MEYLSKENEGKNFSLLCFKEEKDYIVFHN